MKELWIIFFGAGLQDGLNPCIFMAAAVFILLGFWLASSFEQRIAVRIIFVVVYCLSFLIFNFGPGQALILQKNFIPFAKILYSILSLGTIVFGVLFFKDWVLLSTGHATEGLFEKKVNYPTVLMFMTTVVLSMLLSALATLWPVNKYVFLLGSEGIMKGPWLSVFPLVTGYVLASMWPLWFVWACLSIKSRPSFLKILCAAVFFTASSSLILVFK